MDDTLLNFNFIQNLVLGIKQIGYISKCRITSPLLKGRGDKGLRQIKRFASI